MNPKELNIVAIDGALSILPPRMNSLNARAALIAIALQESGLLYRFQQDYDEDDYDDAIGWWQFERIGIEGVETNHATADYASEVRRILAIDQSEVYRAMRYNDVLAAAYARLLLWRYPAPLPGRSQPGVCWDQYIWLWGPGKPRRASWAHNHQQAWLAVE